MPPSPNESPGSTSVAQRHSPPGALVSEPEQRSESKRWMLCQQACMSLAEASEARKARLLALRRRKDGETVEEPIVKNRNFDPETRTLKKRGPNDQADLDDTVEKNVEGLAEKIIADDEQMRAEELDVFNIAPKRANWDLKREMDKKVAKLERKTQEAIHTLIRQRLAAQKGQSDDIVGAMKAQEKQNATEPLSDEDED